MPRLVAPEVSFVRWRDRARSVARRLIGSLGFVTVTVCVPVILYVTGYELVAALSPAGLLVLAFVYAAVRAAAERAK